MEEYKKKKQRNRIITIVIIVVFLGIIFWPQINSMLHPNKFKQSKITTKNSNKQEKSLDSNEANQMKTYATAIYPALDSNNMDVKASELAPDIKLTIALDSYQEKETITEDEVTTKLKEIFLEDPKVTHKSISCNYPLCETSYEYQEAEKTYVVKKQETTSNLYTKSISFYKLESEENNYYLSSKVVFSKDCITLNSCDEEEQGKIFYYKDRDMNEVVVEKTEVEDSKKVLEDNFDKFKTYEFNFKKDGDKLFFSKYTIKPD